MVYDLKGKVAIITGATRGIGKQCALDLAKLGVNIVIAAKSDEPQPTLPGTIYSVAKEIEDLYGNINNIKVLPIKVDVRDEKSVKQCIDKTIQMFGRIDILINNASALWWQPITKTPYNKYDLINQVNSRGTFLMTKECLPHMEKIGTGFIINMSPPISLHPNALKNRVAYSISKYGMTLVALGVAAEYAGTGICANTLWPATVIESSAAENFQLGDISMWRKATILSDCVIKILSEDPKTFNGNELIDEDYLRSRGENDFIKYRCDPNIEPPRMDELEGTNEKQGVFNRGRALTPEQRKAFLESLKQGNKSKL